MPTITKTITEELLNAVGDPAELEKVIHERSNSKGPFYMALAEATTLIVGRLKGISEKYRETEKGYQELVGKAHKSEEENKELDQKLATKNNDIALLEKKLEERKTLLDQAMALGGLGFGPDELGKLHGILSQIAASQGVKQEEAVSIFFHEVDRYEKLVFLELEAARIKTAVDKAQAEAEKWQAQSQSAEAKCRARKSSIEVVEKLLAQGIKEGDIPQWTRVLAKANVTPESLAQSLEKYSSLQKLVQGRQDQADKLEGQINQLSAQVKTLGAEREAIIAAIAAVREKALTEVDHASKTVQKSMDSLTNKTEERVELERQGARRQKELMDQEIAHIMPVARNAINQLTRELRAEVDKAIAGVGQLRNDSLEVGKQVGRYEAMIEANSWIKDLLSIIRGEPDIEAKRVRAVAVSVVRGLHGWFKAGKQDATRTSLTYASNNLLKELQEWTI